MQGPSGKRIWCILALKSDIWWHQFYQFSYKHTHRPIIGGTGGQMHCGPPDQNIGCGVKWPTPLTLQRPSRVIQLRVCEFVDVEVNGVKGGNLRKPSLTPQCRHTVSLRTNRVGDSSGQCMPGSRLTVRRQRAHYPPCQNVTPPHSTSDFTTRSADSRGF